METARRKYQTLLSSLNALGSVAVAFSGGVDSAFLLRAAADALGDRVLAVTASSRVFPHRELAEAERFCAERGIRQIVVEFDALSIEGFRQNPRNRCYLCKKELFQSIQNIAAESGIAAVAEGSNVDDEGDYRPGLRAVKELGVLSPLREAGLCKDEIRQLSRELGLPTWDKPSYACLASRFVYGETISGERLAMVDKAEQLLLGLGFRQVRVRVHGEGRNTIARVEVLPEDFPALLGEDTRWRIVFRLRELGFSYVSLDLDGYHTGSMNRALPKEET